MVELEVLSNASRIYDGIYDKQPCCFRADGSVCRAVKPQHRQPQMTENKPIVQKDIYACLGKGAIHEKFTLIGSDQQRIPHLIDIQEGEAPDANAQERKRLV